MAFRCADLQMHAGRATLTQPVEQLVDQSAAQPLAADALEQVDVQVGRVRGHDLVGRPGWLVQQPDQLVVAASTRAGWILPAEERPPVLLGPGLEGACVIGPQDVAGHPLAVGDDEGQLRPADDVRADEDVTEQVRILVDGRRVVA